jgi:thiamine transport system permease protein
VARRDGSSGSRPLLWLPALAFLGLFFILPLARILARSLSPAALGADSLRILLSAFGITLFQATLSMLLTLALGLPAAYLFARFDFPGKSLVRALTAVPFMLPTVVVAAGFNALLGPRGWLNLGLMGWLGLESPPVTFVGTLAAILIAHVFYNATIVIRIVGNALAHLDSRLEGAARTLGADTPRLWRDVILPLLTPALLAAALLVFLFDFTSFGVILLLGGPEFATLEVEIYVQALQLLNLPVAALLSLFQLACTLALALLYARWADRAAVQSAPRPADEAVHAPRTLLERTFVPAMLAALVLFYVLPLIALPLRSVARLEAARGERADVAYGLTVDYYTELFVNRRGSIMYVPPIRATVNSLAYAAATAALSLALGLPAAAALARPGRLERLIDPLLILPLGASAVTMGLGFVVTFDRLLASPWLVPLAHTLIALPFVVRILQPALASIPDRLRHAAASLGAAPARAWLAVDWPIIRRAALAAGAFAFTVSLGDFGAAVLLARPEYPTIPVAIFRFLSQPGGLNYGQAMAMATILMLITLLGMLTIERARLPGSREF